jgi:hypothetical protein
VELTEAALDLALWFGKDLIARGMFFWTGSARDAITLLRCWCNGG